MTMKPEQLLSEPFRRVAWGDSGKEGIKDPAGTATSGKGELMFGRG